MHPLRKYLDLLKANAPDKVAYRKAVLCFASHVGVHDKLFNNIANPNQKTSELAPYKALRMEEASHGAVPAMAVCPKIYERIEASRRVLALADKLGY